ALLEFNGVGKKVANCVMLFSYHRIAAFPVDVWIQRVIDEKYNGSFPLEKYDGFAGVIQQYMFFHARNIK
nr:DNA-3-methyladenine glycosylase 2 family protein [Lachnospiraceae bacterium]